MIITCQNCNTQYKLDPALLAATGSRVRCSDCGHEFVVYPPDEVKSSSVAEALPPDTAAAAAGLAAAPGSMPIDESYPKPLVEDSLFGRESPKATGALNEETLAGLEEIDFEEMDGRLASETTEPEVPADWNLDLDLGEEEDVLEAEDDALEDVDLDLDLSEDDKAIEAGDDALEDLALELDLGEDEDVGEAASGKVPDLALDLDLGEDHKAVEAGDDALDDFELELDDLELELDSDKGAPPAEVEGGEDRELDLELDLDFSDIEMATEVEADEPQELELDFDFEPVGSDLPPAEDATVTAQFQDEELDLSDIEKMLETGQCLDLPTADTGPEGESSVDSGDRPSRAIPEEDDIDNDLGLVSTHDLAAATDLFDEEMDKGEAVDREIAAYAETYELGAIPARLGQDDAAAELETDPAGNRSAPGVKRGISKLLVALLILLLVGGGVYGAHLMGVQLPWVSDLIGGQAKDDSGNLRIATFGIDSRFVENATAGRLFVITGKVRNEYEQPRSLIRIRGSLFSKAKQRVGTENVFCGNVLADLDLVKLDIAEIKKRLGVRSGANKSNLNLAPGGVIPFMVVFSNLPPDLDEFTIEVAGSQ